MAKRTRRSAQAAQKSQDQISAVPPTLPIALVQLKFAAGKRSNGVRGSITRWNKTAENLTGLNGQAVIGRSFSEFLEESVRGSVLKYLHKVYLTGKTAHLKDVSVVTPKGPLSVNLTAWKLPSGIGLFLAPPQESTEEDFSESVSILDSITDAFFLLDRSWRFAYLSPKSEQFLKRLDLSIADSIGKNIWDLVPAARNTNGYRHFQNAVAERKSVEFEEYFPPLKTWFEVRLHPIGDGLSVYVRDITRRKLAETSFLKLSNAVEQSADAVFVTNLDGEIEYVNPAFEVITGYRRSEVLGKKPNILKSDEHDQEYFRTLWDQVLAGETFRATISNRKKTGEPYYVEETITPVRDAAGNITHFVATLRDITERKQNEERFKALIENSSDGIALLARDGRVRYTGPSTARILGYVREDFTGRLGFDFIHPEDRQNIETAFRELTATPRRIMLLQFRMKNRSGKWLWIETIANNLLDEPSIQAVVLNYRDITDRKHMEEAFKKSEIEYRNLFDRANDAIFIFEPHGETILEANVKACSLYGFTKDELIGMSLKNLTKDIQRGEFEIRELLRHESSRNFETVHFNKKSEPMEMLVNSSVVEYAGRTAIMSIIRDITELRKLEHQLRQAQKMESIGTLAGGIAHDFNNILSIILGYVSLIKRGKIQGEKFEEGIDTIAKAAQRGAVLVKQILTFARKADVVFESVKVNELLTDLSKLLGETFPKTVTFDLQLNPELPTIVADANQLHQVFLNLCVNARDAMTESGTITIQTGMVAGKSLQERFPDARQSEYIHVRLSDTGTGMDDQTRLRVFEPFFTTKEQGRGTGLGLAVVYGIVNNHHGFIDVESSLGKGTTFHLYFPVQMRSFETIQEGIATAEQIAGGTETILLVEDERMLQSLLKELLEGHGYKVFTALDGAEAVDTYKRLANEIDLVLTDIGLPKVSGWEVCREVLATNARAKVIVASGYLDPNSKSDLKESKARDFIHKPYLPEDVLKRIRTVLDAD
ncbi:MAG TPA: PAS domain S-box protein [Bacteroidota bacterium]